jgi:hypothetical protein
MDHYNIIDEFGKKDIFEGEVAIFQGKSCCVVGNSGSVLDKDNGKFIDECDFVIRINLSKTDGFEQHVGSKTNLRFLNQHPFHSLLNPKGAEGHKENFPEFEVDFLIKLKNQTIVNTDRVRMTKENLDKITENNCKIINLNSVLLDKLYRCSPRPTTGFVSLITAISYFDDVYATGFDFYVDPEREHYFEKVISYDRSKVHNIQLEKKIFLELVDQGKIKSI